jgi:hypothetical protein
VREVAKGIEAKRVDPGKATCHCTDGTGDPEAAAARVVEAPCGMETDTGLLVTTGEVYFLVLTEVRDLCTPVLTTFELTTFRPTGVGVAAARVEFAETRDGNAWAEPRAGTTMMIAAGTRATRDAARRNEEREGM